jgi:hypothetical protein
MPARLGLLAAGLLAAGAGMPADAALYKWTGAVDTGFSNPQNWLRDSGGTWVATTTAPANQYGADTIVFEGAPTARMPTLAQHWKLHSIQFRSAGWTLNAGTNSLQLVQFYATHLGVPPAIAITSTGAGVNTVNGNLWFNGGGYLTAASGNTLRHVGVILSTATGLAGTSKQLGFGGGGTLYLGGAAGNNDQTRFNMEGGTLHLAKSSGVAIGPLRMTAGLVKLLAAHQIAVNGTWCLSGNSSIDFGGFDQYVTVLGVGSDPESVAVGAPWSGTLSNTAKLQVGSQNNGTTSNHGRLTVNSTISQTVVFTGGLDSLNGRYADAGCFLMVGDSTNDVDLQIDGPLLAGNTGNGGTTLKIYGATTDGAFSAGTVALTQPTTWGGTYARLYLSAHLLANATDGSSIGTPAVVDVLAPDGILGGHGQVQMAAGASLNVYGTLRPGSSQQPSGTLCVGLASAPTAVVLHPDSEYEVRVAPNGACPTLDLEGSLQIGGNTYVVVTGAAAPTPGVDHVVLCHTGARTGAFAGLEAYFPGADDTTGTLSYHDDGNGGGWVAVRFDPTLDPLDPLSPEYPLLSWAPPTFAVTNIVQLGSTYKTLKLDKTKDYVVKLPTAYPWKGELNIYGGRNVVVIGGEIRIPSTAEDPTFTGSHRALYLKEQQGTVHVEGVLFSGGGLMEGINLDQRVPGCVVQLQNIHCETLYGSYSGNHADVIQTWAGPSVLRVDRLTATTTYQGFFLLPNQMFPLSEGGHRPTLFDFRRINLFGTDASAYMLWRDDGNLWPVSNRYVWVRPAASKAGHPDSYLWPKPIATGDTTWDDVNEGLPPYGDFVPVGVAGRGYVSPGYRPQR